MRRPLLALALVAIALCSSRPAPRPPPRAGPTRRPPRRLRPPPAPSGAPTPRPRPPSRSPRRSRAPRRPAAPAAATWWRSPRVNIAFEQTEISAPAGAAVRDPLRQQGRGHPAQRRDQGRVGDVHVQGRHHHRRRRDATTRCPRWPPARTSSCAPSTRTWSGRSRSAAEPGARTEPAHPRMSRMTARRRGLLPRRVRRARSRPACSRCRPADGAAAGRPRRDGVLPGRRRPAVGPGRHPAHGGRADVDRPGGPARWAVRSCTSWRPPRTASCPRAGDARRRSTSSGRAGTR